MAVDYSLQLETTFYVVWADEKLSEQKRKWLSLLYQPFIGSASTNLFVLLHDTIASDEIESDIQDHHKLLTKLKIKKMADLLEKRHRLEACGLLETYRNDKLTIYLLKPVLSPSEFFDDIVLSKILEDNIGISECENLKKQLLVRRYDINKYQNVSKSFDEVFNCLKEDDHIGYGKWWTSIKKSRPYLKKHHLDFDNVLAFIEPLNIFKTDLLHSKKFYDMINSVGFAFSLNAEEIAQALKMIANLQKEFNEAAFLKAIKKIYDKKTSVTEIKIQPVQNTNKDPELVKLLEEIPHNILVESRFKKGLISSEIAILETLHRKHGFSHGMINALLIYVLENTNGSFPSLNYFLKVGNEWYRRGIKTVEQALEYMENSTYQTNQKPQTKSSYRKKDNSPKWVDDYIKENIQAVDKDEDEEDISIEELEKLFNNKKR